MTTISRIRTEIERLRKLVDDHNYYLDNSEQAVGYGLALDDIWQFLDTLEVEEKDVDLSVEIERFYRTDEYKMAESLGRGFEAIARHFAEWGERNAYKSIMKKADEVRDKMYDIDYDIKIGQIEPIKEYKEPLTWEDIEECIAEISSSKGAEHMKR